MAEIAPAGGGPNRMFVVLAIGLGALLVLGLLSLGGFFLIQTMTRPSVSPTVQAKVASTATRAPTNTAAPTATEVATEVATPTLVNSGGNPPSVLTQIASGAGTGTPTVIGELTGTPGTPGAVTTGTVTSGTTTPGNLPSTGLGEDLLWPAGGLVLILIIFAARRARTA